MHVGSMRDARCMHEDDLALPRDFVEVVKTTHALHGPHQEMVQVQEGRFIHISQQKGL